jgi:multimeric flavodoxin WrbA
MKLMAIIGSPRKGGNTEILADKVIEGCKSKAEVEVNNFFIVDKKIEYCTGCMTCALPPPGTRKCVIEDDMAGILDEMRECDAYIFGSPNHMHTITAPLLNFLARMMPLFEMEVEFDDKGNMIGGAISSTLKRRKAAIVISQGDPLFSSSLVYEVMKCNLDDFGLKRVGDVISRENLLKGAVAEKDHDLQAAFDVGVLLATSSGWG